VVDEEFTFLLMTFTCMRKLTQRHPLFRVVLIQVVMIGCVCVWNQSTQGGSVGGDEGQVYQERYLGNNVSGRSGCDSDRRACDGHYEVHAVGREPSTQGMGHVQLLWW